jgi:hypothetical protein
MDAELRASIDVIDRALDVLKLAQFILPPDQPALAPLRENFRQYEARLEELRSMYERMNVALVRLETFPQALESVRGLQEAAAELLPPVEESIETLQERRDDRIENLQRLAQRDEILQGKVDPEPFKVENFRQRVDRLPQQLADLKAEIEQDVGRWEEMRQELLQLKPVAQRLAEDLVSVAAPLQAMVERLQTELSRPDRDAIPPEMQQFLDALNRLLNDPDGQLARIRQQLADLEEVLTRTFQEVEGLSEAAAAIGLVQARARLESTTLEAIDIEEKEAVETAAQLRLDWMNARAGLVNSWRLIEFNADALDSDVSVIFSGDINTLGDNPFRFRSTTGQLRVGLVFDAPITRLDERNRYRQAIIEYQQARRSYMNFTDTVVRGLRNILRTVEVNQLNFELRRAAVDVAIDQVELAQLNLRRPPPPGQPGQPAATGQLGDTAARDLVNAVDALQNAQNNFLGVWVNYYQQRMELDLDLGTFQLDDEGLWIDPGTIRGSQRDGDAACDDAPVPPELIPSPPIDGSPEGNSPEAIHTAPLPLDLPEPNG